MASMAQVASPTYPPPPTFSHTSTESSINGMNRSHSALNSFDGPQSVASTPTPTPPASRSMHNMFYGNSNYPSTTGSQSQLGTSRHLQDSRPIAHQQYYATGQKPQIYTAVYSGISVYEMEVNGTAVMRRRSDSCLNATQILKVAGIEKGKRTKVLEREILSGQHEKVQGGYGKYQGTWVNYKRGVEFARQYGVAPLLQPLFEYDMGQDGMIAGSGSVDTPTKEQAMAAQRKRNMMNGGPENRAPAQSPNGTFFKNISSSAANAVNAISKAKFDSPVPRAGSGNRPMKPVRQPSLQMAGSQDSAYAGSSQQSMRSDNSFGGNSQLDPALRGGDPSFSTNIHDQHINGDMQEPPRKRIRPSSSQYPRAQEVNGSYDTSMRDMTPTEANESFAYPHGNSQSNMDYKLMGLQPLPQPSSNSALEKQQMLTSLFLNPTQTDFSNHPALQKLSGDDLDIPIDQSAHTALHWAATLARTSLLRALINKGASIYRLNGGGETALIRAALTTNNLDQQNFPEVLELLGPTIEVKDGRGRTVLHHIAVSSAVQGRSSACRYYLESLLEFVVRQGSASNSQQNSFRDPTAPPAPKSIGLVTFMSEIVNAADMCGDTALNLAARIGNKSIIQQLFEVGADPTIPNRGGLKPVDFGVGGDPEHTDFESSGQVSRLHKNTSSKVLKSSQELRASIATILNDTESSFRSELTTKQSLIDSTHTRLRESSALLAEEKRRLADLESKASRRRSLRQRIANLRRANEQQRSLLLGVMNGDGRPSSAPEQLRGATIGEADAGLDINPMLLPPVASTSTSSFQPTHNPIPSLTQEQHTYLIHLPTSLVLRARTHAYRQNNTHLESQAKALQSQSSELERQLRKVVSLCTGVEAERIEEMVGGLWRAVESEGADVEVGRVREFLRRVESEQGGGMNE